MQPNSPKTTVRLAEGIKGSSNQSMRGSASCMIVRYETKLRGNGIARSFGFRATVGSNMESSLAPYYLVSIWTRIVTVRILCNFYGDLLNRGNRNKLISIDMPLDYRHSAQEQTDLDMTAAHWLIQFSHMEIPPANSQGLRQLQNKMLDVLRMRNDQDRKRFPHRTQLSTWQRQLRNVLCGLANGNRWQLHSKAERVAINASGRVVVECTYEPTTNDYWTFLPKAFDCLTSASLRICLNNSCKKPFIGNKRARYCSVKCRNAVNKRAYRQGQRRYRATTI